MIGVCMGQKNLFRLKVQCTDFFDDGFGITTGVDHGSRTGFPASQQITFYRIKSHINVETCNIERIRIGGYFLRDPFLSGNGHQRWSMQVQGTGQLQEN